MLKQYTSLVILSLCVSFSAMAMIDNRYLVPYLLEKPFVRLDSSLNRLQIQPFIMTARHSFGDDDESHQPLFNIYGSYNEVEIDKAALFAGDISKSLLRSDFQGFVNSIPWFMNGHMEAYGVGAHWYLNWYQHVTPCITHCFGFGIVGGVMHVGSRLSLERNTKASQAALLGPGDIFDITVTNAELHKALGLQPPLWSKTGITDLDIYLRWASVLDYRFKLKRLEAAFKLGLLAPTADPRNINNPASIPFGLDRHWGMYGEVRVDAVLKEDLSAGFLLNLSKRFRRTSLQRMPIFREPTNYGAVVGLAEVEPGVTIGFLPYVNFERVRNGLGFRVDYSLVFHEEDEWDDRRRDRSIPVNLGLLERRSQWGLEHLTLGIMYDFAYNCEYHGTKPIASFMWDIPVQVVVSREAFKTHGISLIFELEF